MWKIDKITNPTTAQLWFSDGKPVSAQRGGPGRSSRLIVENQGFIDISDYSEIKGADIVVASFLDLNNRSIVYDRPLVSVNLVLPGDGSFSFSLLDGDDSVTGKFKPIPQVSSSDALFMRQMVLEKYVPYQKIPDAPGKPIRVIQDLGKQLFPFSPYSFELAVSVYDWTTASFTRMVLMEIFSYTDLLDHPLPLDLDSIASMIFKSAWKTYKPTNPDFMKSFMMKPTDSLSSVQEQLNVVRQRLQKFSNVQNRMLAAAFASMPRTTFQHAPMLFSGQPDIFQLGLSRIPIEFLECPLNVGPPGVQLEMAYDEASSSFISPGKIITTKMTWSFGDSPDVAAHYENGLILIALPPDDNTRVWESASYITPLSDDPEKNEYTFAPGTQFEILYLDTGTIEKPPGKFKAVKFITLRLLSRRRHTVTGAAEEAINDEAHTEPKEADLDTTAFSSAGLDTDGLDTVDISHIAVDAAEAEATNLTAEELDPGNFPFGNFDLGRLRTAYHEATGTHANYSDADNSDPTEAIPLPRSVLLEIPVRHTKYPPYNHYHTHLDGGRRCGCAEETSE